MAPITAAWLIGATARVSGGRAHALANRALAGRRPPIVCALHKTLVNNNESTIAGVAGHDRSAARTHWADYEKSRVGSECSATREQNIKPEQARRIPSAASNARFDRMAAGLKSRRLTPFIVNPCGSLLIHRVRPCAGPVRSGDSRVRRHGQRPPCRPPFPRNESGGRP